MQRPDDPKERRRYPRFSVGFPMSFLNGTAREATVNNLSRCGFKASVLAAPLVEMGTYLILYFQVPGEHSELEVELAAVRWSIGKQFGGEFLFLKAHESHRLIRFLASQEEQAGKHEESPL